MALIVEDGTGVENADSYAAITTIDAYWAGRTHLAFATAWAAGSIEQKEGAAREATSYLDDLLAGAYRGRRAGYVQGLEHPRIGAKDDQGFELPALPPQLVKAVCELAGRSISAPLSSDLEVSGAIKRKREKVGPIEEETEYAGAAMIEQKYGLVLQGLAPILNGSQPGAAPEWNWR